MNISNIKLVTSNKFKLKEFRRFNEFINQSALFYSLDAKDIQKWTGDYQAINH